MSSGDLVRTALFDEHVALDANIVDFHGFELPIWYSNIKEEHLATRASAGLFDVSHMAKHQKGEIFRDSPLVFLFSLNRLSVSVPYRF